MLRALTYLEGYREERSRALRLRIPSPGSERCRLRGVPKRVSWRAVCGFRWGGSREGPTHGLPDEDGPPSAASRKYPGIRAPLHPLQLRCASSPYSPGTPSLARLAGAAHRRSRCFRLFARRCTRGAAVPRVRRPTGRGGGYRGSRPRSPRGKRGVETSRARADLQFRQPLRGDRRGSRPGSPVRDGTPGGRRPRQDRETRVRGATGAVSGGVSQGRLQGSGLSTGIRTRRFSGFLPRRRSSRIRRPTSSVAEGCRAHPFKARRRLPERRRRDRLGGRRASPRERRSAGGGEGAGRPAGEDLGIDPLPETGDAGLRVPGPGIRGEVLHGNRLRPLSAPAARGAWRPPDERRASRRNCRRTGR